jgi:hypothetical protein
MYIIFNLFRSLNAPRAPLATATLPLRGLLEARGCAIFANAILRNLIYK